MLDELSLHVDSVEQHACQGDYNHLLVNFRNLGKGLEDSWYDLVLDDFQLTVLLDRKVRDSGDYVAEDLFLLLVIKKNEQVFQEAFA